MGWASWTTPPLTFILLLIIQIPIKMIHLLSDPSKKKVNEHIGPREFLIDCNRSYLLNESTLAGDSENFYQVNLVNTYS